VAAVPAIAAFALILAAPAQAQVGASVGVHSDFRYRGRTLSDERPALSAAIAYDHESGLYVGGAVLAGEPKGEGVRLLRAVAYTGYATKTSAGPSLDVGVGAYRVVDYRGGFKRAYEYAEVYGGVATEHLTLRAHYSPDYYGSGLETVYLDLSASYRPVEGFRLFAHAGLLTYVGGRFDVRDRHDFALGVAKSLGPVELAATWTRMEPQAYGPDREPESQDALTLSVLYFF
jgi:uncharacterized protein (TIGR02001 family)